MSEGQKELRRCRSLFFFFQAEDGIRDKLVTGVQTCALPISPGASRASCGADTLRAPRLDSYTGTSDGRDATASAPQGDRKSVVYGKSVDLGGRRIIKKKKKRTRCRTEDDNNHQTTVSGGA